MNYVAKQNVGDENQIRSKASKRKLEKNLLLDPVSKKEAKRKKRERGKGGKGEKEQPGCVQIKKLTQNQRHLVTLKELSLMWPIVQVMVFFYL